MILYQLFNRYPVYYVYLYWTNIELYLFLLNVSLGKLRRVKRAWSYPPIKESETRPGGAFTPHEILKVSKKKCVMYLKGHLYDNYSDKLRNSKYVAVFVNIFRSTQTIQLLRITSFKTLLKMMASLKF